MNFLKKIWKRTFGTDGGSRITIRNENGNLDATSAIAAVVRGVVALVLAAVAILLANAVGVPVEVITDLAEQIKEMLS